MRFFLLNENYMFSILRLFFLRTAFENGSLISEIELLQPLNLDITIERNLAAAWYSDIPDIKIIGHLKPMNVRVNGSSTTMIGIIALKLLFQNCS